LPISATETRVGWPWGLTSTFWTAPTILPLESSTFAVAILDGGLLTADSFVAVLIEPVWTGMVGAVQKVEVSPQGQPTRVSVALIGKGERMVVLDADAVRYDVAKNEIATDATAEQMSAMMNTR
jgi:hypothetical protein